MRGWMGGRAVRRDGGGKRGGEEERKRREVGEREGQKTNRCTGIDPITREGGLDSRGERRDSDSDSGREIYTGSIIRLGRLRVGWCVAWMG